MDYRNADGSLAEMCGNGVRVFARYLLDQGLAAGPGLAIATRAGTRMVRAEADNQFTVDMGPVAVLGEVLPWSADSSCPAWPSRSVIRTWPAWSASRSRLWT